MDPIHFPWLSLRVAQEFGLVPKARPCTQRRTVNSRYSGSRFESEYISNIRAYPNIPATWKAMRAQAKWRKARKCSGFSSHRTRRRRKRFSLAPRADVCRKPKLRQNLPYFIEVKSLVLAHPLGALCRWLGEFYHDALDGGTDQFRFCCK
jgi:hypothetical protein